MLRKINDGCGSDCVCVVLVKDLEMWIHKLIKKSAHFVKKILSKKDVTYQKLKAETKQQTIIHINIITQMQHTQPDKKKLSQK